MTSRTDHWFKYICIGFVLGASFTWAAFQEVPWDLLMEMG